MGTRQIVIYTAECDVCGRRADNDEYGMYGSTPEEAVQHMTTNLADDGGGWTLTESGTLVCNLVKDSAHEDRHAEAGKRMSACAMSVAFDGWMPRE
jgi:hypothetical protein